MLIILHKLSFLGFIMVPLRLHGLLQKAAARMIQHESCRNSNQQTDKARKPKLLKKTCCNQA